MNIYYKSYGLHVDQQFQIPKYQTFTREQDLDSPYAKCEPAVIAVERMIPLPTSSLLSNPSTCFKVD